jgi:hypothetical protein
MKISNFEDLECWQIARKLAKQVYRFCRALDGSIDIVEEILLQNVSIH